MRRAATWQEAPLTAPNALEHPRSCADTHLRNRRALQQPPRSPSDPQAPLATSGRFRRPNRPETPQHAGVSPSRQSQQRTAPARNRTKIQDLWRNRRPFPPEPPRSREDATASEAAAADEHAAKRMLAPDAPQTIAQKRSWKTPVEPRTRPYKKQLPSTPANPPKSHS